MLRRWPRHINVPTSSICDPCRRRGGSHRETRAAAETTTVTARRAPRPRKPRIKAVVAMTRSARRASHEHGGDERECVVRGQDGSD